MSLLCALPLATTLFAACAPSPALVGYVEGEYVRLGPVDVARIERLAVRQGDRVAAGRDLVMLERTDAEHAVAEARAQLARARAELNDQRTGRRPEEIAVIDANLAAARAEVREAERALDRRSDLVRRGVSAQADLDQAQTTRDVALARVRELTANLAVARLPARADALTAAEERVAVAAAALKQADWRLAQRTLVAPRDGRITEIARWPGELAGPSAPVLVLLPDGAARLVFFAGEAQRAAFAAGSAIAVACTGCPPGLRATISHVAAEPEFTPPVIYSAETRQKLVYRIEARPDPAAVPHLAPGQIVDIRPAAP